MRDITELNVEDLEQILATNTLPEDVALTGISSRTDFDKLFKHRATPKFIAQALLKDKLKTRVLSEGSELKSERMEVRKAEIELRKMRLETQTQQQTNIYKKLQTLEDGLNILISGLANLTRIIQQKEEGSK